MVIEITDTALKRLENYLAVMQKRHAETEKRQWKEMTYEVMQQARTIKDKLRKVACAAAYARHLHLCQCGFENPAKFDSAPWLNQALVDLMTELGMEFRLVKEE